MIIMSSNKNSNLFNILSLPYKLFKNTFQPELPSINKPTEPSDEKFIDISIPAMRLPEVFDKPIADIIYEKEPQQYNQNYNVNNDLLDRSHAWGYIAPVTTDLPLATSSIFGASYEKRGFARDTRDKSFVADGIGNESRQKPSTKDTKAYESTIIDSSIF